MVFIRPKAGIQAQKHPSSESQALRPPSGNSSSRGVSALVVSSGKKVFLGSCGMLIVGIIDLWSTTFGEGRGASGEGRLNISMIFGVISA